LSRRQRALAAGAAGTRGAAGTGTTFGTGGRGELIAHLGGAGAHQLGYFALATKRALHLRVVAKDQLLEILVASLTMKLKDRHIKHSWVEFFEGRAREFFVFFVFFVRARPPALSPLPKLIF
jgi:hypothetical protein